MLILLSIALPCWSNGNCPDEKSITSLAERSKQTYQDFLTTTLYQRLSCQYNDGQLSEQNKKILTRAVKKYSEAIKQILAEQLEYKKYLEDYTGSDWENKFGSTGLWNQLKKDISNSQARLSQIKNANQPAQNTNKDDFETNAAIAFAQLKTGSDEHLNKTIEKWPQSRELFGKLVLQKLDTLADYSKITPTEAVLAAEAVIKNTSPNYTDILIKLADTAQLPIVFYAAGEAVQKDAPLQGLEFFIQAGKDKKQTFAADALKKSADLAYSLYNQNIIGCEKTINVLKNYLDQTADDYNGLYCYAFVLKNCQKKESAIKILEQIINSNDTIAITAEYDLIMLKLEVENDYAPAAQKLKALLEKTDENNELYNSILETYCKILLNLGGKENAQKVVNLPAKNNIPALKARAYWILGQKNEAADHLLKAENLSPQDVDFCIIILRQSAVNFDELAEAADKNFLKNCTNLAEKINFQDTSIDAEILSLEFQLVQTDSNCPEILAQQIEQICQKTSIENPDFLRLYARFNTKKGDFEQAYDLWSKLAGVNENNNGFWPAKYYQLMCLSKISEKKHQKAIHAAEVLLHSRTDIPQFWQKKLITLIAQ